MCEEFRHPDGTLVGFVVLILAFCWPKTAEQNLISATVCHIGQSRRAHFISSIEEIFSVQIH